MCDYLPHSLEEITDVSASMALVTALGARSQLAAGYQRCVVPVKTVRGDVRHRAHCVPSNAEHVVRVL